MLNLNRAQVLGNVTKDPEMRYTANGQAVTSFTIATNRRWKGRDGAPDGESTEYHDLVVWGQQAETVTPMLKKGTPAYAEGRLQTRSWEGQDGVKRYRTEIVADTVIVLGSRGGGAYSAPNAAGNPVENIAASEEKKGSEDKNKNQGDDIDIDEIPF